MSIELHGSLAQEPSVLIDTTVQEKNITYPTDAKLAIKIINRLNKLHNTLVREVLQLFKHEQAHHQPNGF
jgi:hypothetical protein